jgi:2-desacetyl-2-hydroxyethyl bacteriochlorophyllide A dehydrogenase
MKKGKMMKAVIFESAGKLIVKQIPRPILQKTAFTKRNGGKLIFTEDNLVLLRILKAGICGTDLGILNIPQGYPAAAGTILGHEFVGEVLKIGKRVGRVKIGDIVVADEHISCGDCKPCRLGFLNRCEEVASMGMSTNGGFTQYTVMPDKQIYKIPKNLDLNKAVLFEPLYCAVHAINKLGLRPDLTVLILGAGPLGCCFVELCRIHGLKKIIIAEPNSYRRNFAEELGATAVVYLTSIAKKELANNVDVVIDASGMPAAVKEAIETVKPYGKISLFGQQNDLAKTEFSFVEANRKELKFYGADAASPFAADQTIDYLTRKDFRLHKIVTHELSLDDTLKGIELMRQKKAIKVVINPWL